MFKSQNKLSNDIRIFCNFFFFTYLKGVPGEGGPAGATGPRVSSQTSVDFTKFWSAEY